MNNYPKNRAPAERRPPSPPVCAECGKPDRDLSLATLPGGELKILCPSCRRKKGAAT